MTTASSYSELENIFPNRPHWNEHGVWVSARNDPPICWCPKNPKLATNLCKTCQSLRIRHFILCEAESRTIELGALNDIVKRPGCDLCSLIALGCKQTWQGLWNEEARASTICTLNSIEPSRQQARGYALQISETGGVWRWVELEALFRGYGIGYAPTDRNIEIQSKVDVDFLKTSVRRCETTHPGCASSAEPYTPEKMRIIDLNHMNITPAPEACRYLALSYVWGRMTNKFLTLTVANEETLSRKDALLQASLPQTIQDAMQLCLDLGERYLWIDSLCIVQDEPVSQKQQIDIMDLIYASATLTIVAAAGDSADSGIPGMNGWPRKLGRQIITIQDIEISSILPRMKDTVDRSVWNTRGWTYQERMFSHRCIFLTEAQAYHACSQEVSYEISNRLFPNGWGVERLNAPTRYADPKQYYYRAIEEYTTRSLTSQSDVLRAFQGIMNDLSRKHDQDFFFGLPNGDFEEALLWQSVGKAEKRHTSVDLPSWSWASHYGAIRYSFTELRITKDSTEPPLRAFWQQGKEPNYFRIDWRVNTTGSKLVHIRQQPLSFPEVSSINQAPLGIVNIALLTPGSLLFRTQHAFFALANSVPFRTIDSWWTDYTQDIDLAKICIASILHPDRLGDPIGFIEVDRIWSQQNLASEEGIWEFVAISLAAADSDDYMHRHFTMRRNIGWPLVLSRNVRELVVNVMLIERHGNIARRLAVGKIYLDCWELSDPQDSWIVLG